MELDDPKLVELLGQARRDQLADEIELLEGAGAEFDMERVRHGKLSPVFFGSALTNFGVEPFLEEFLRMTTPPLSRKAGDQVVDAFDDDFSAFRVQDPGQHEQGASRSYRLHACVLRSV